MNAPRILLPCVAFAAGGAAAFLVGSDEENKSEAPAGQFATTDAVIAKIDIAKREIGVAADLSDRDLQWLARRSATTGGSGISANP